MSVNAVSPAAPAMWQSLIRNEIAVAFAAVLGALIIGLLLIVMIGVPLSDAIGAFVDGAFGSGYAIAASINRATVFAAVGLGFIFANQANLTNVGGEGQIAVGGIAALMIQAIVQTHSLFAAMVLAIVAPFTYFVRALVLIPVFAALVWVARKFRRFLAPDTMIPPNGAA